MHTLILLPLLMIYVFYNARICMQIFGPLCTNLHSAFQIFDLLGISQSPQKSITVIKYFRSKKSKFDLVNDITEADLGF